MKIDLVQSYPTGCGGIKNTGEFMKLYLADTGPNHYDAARLTQHVRKLNILSSYHYYRTTNFDTITEEFFPIVKPGWFADSGAYSAATQGAAINLDDYAKWLIKWRQHFDVYCNLDVIGDPHQSMDNLRALESYGLKPLPVFHVGSDFKHLKSLIEEYDYIALGGMVPHMRYTDRIMRWLVQCFKIAGTKARFHGLGATNWTVLASLPWRSVDSSSWGAGFRFGSLPVYNKTTSKLVTVQIGDMSAAVKYKDDLARYGVTPEQVGNREKNTRLINAYVAAMSYMDLQDWLTERHGAIRLYLAEASQNLHGTLGAFQNGK